MPRPAYERCMSWVPSAIILYGTSAHLVIAQSGGRNVGECKITTA